MIPLSNLIKIVEQVKKMNYTGMRAVCVFTHAYTNRISCVVSPEKSKVIQALRAYRCEPLSFIEEHEKIPKHQFIIGHHAANIEPNEQDG